MFITRVLGYKSRTILPLVDFLLYIATIHDEKDNQNIELNI